MNTPNGFFSYNGLWILQEFSGIDVPHDLKNVVMIIYYLKKGISCGETCGHCYNNYFKRNTEFLLFSRNHAAAN